MSRHSPPAVIDLARDAEQDQSRIERAFLFWIDDGRHPELLATGSDPRDVVPVGMALDLLRDCPRALTPAQARHLGLAANATVATAAAALVRARRDPDGPRCRSYRSAVLYLSGLALLLADSGQDAPLHRHAHSVTVADLVDAV